MSQFLQNLFMDYDRTEIECKRALYSNCISTDISFTDVYGVVIEKYRQRDKQTLQAIRINVPIAEVKAVILESLMIRKDALERTVDPDFIQKAQLKTCSMEISEIEILPLDAWIYKYLSVFFDILPDLDRNDFLGLIYIYYAYEKHKRKRDHACNNEQPNINKMYVKHFNKSSQFQKYGLLPIDEERELLCLNPPRIYDKRKDKTIFIKNIPLVLVKKLNELINEKQIKQLAIRGSDNDIYDGKVTSELIQEAIERGKIFTLCGLGNPEVTKLYSNNYEDCLWIVIDSANITFEELCQDFKVYEDKIVTQVIHLQYTQTAKGTFITHLDHEYIYYTIDEFDRRRQTPEQKGTACTRMKTFKIDNSNISFDSSYKVIWKDSYGNNCDPVFVPFLCYVLDCYFQHKDLLYEYFKSLI